jgi:phytoene synthase
MSSASTVGAVPQSNGPQGGPPAAAGSSFFWAMRLLPASRREAMYAVYAYCREVDDIADSLEPHALRLEQLAEWRLEIDRLYEGRATHPVARALNGPVANFGLRRQDFLGVLEGMEMDAREDICAPPLTTLDRYCDCVASAVGRLSVRVFGLSDTLGIPLAHSLGRALQLTNILRDIAEDGLRSRLYVPAEFLDAHGVPKRDVSAALTHPSLPAACRDLAGVARDHFATARECLRACPRTNARPAAMMEAVYRRYLDRLVEADWADLEHPIRLSRPVKLWIALRHGLL